MQRSQHIGLLKVLKAAVCGIQCIDLTKDAIKILEMFFSYNKNIELEQNFKTTITVMKTF